MELGHTENLISVFLAIGNEVGSSFNYEILPTVQEFGPGEFCWASVPLPSTLNITDGTNATVQIITNAHSGGGLYNVRFPLATRFCWSRLTSLQCADITFTSTAPEQPSACTNGTGISATPLAQNAYTFANETESHEGGHGDEEPSATESGGASASASGEAAATESAADGANVMTVGWGILGAAVLGAVALM